MVQEIKTEENFYNGNYLHQIMPNDLFCSVELSAAQWTNLTKIKRTLFVVDLSICKFDILHLHSVT